MKSAITLSQVPESAGGPFVLHGPLAESFAIAATLRKVGRRTGHVHFADSNRQAIGFGHTAPAPIIATLRETGYQGYLSAEVLPLPDPLTACRQTRRRVRGGFPPPPRHRPPRRAAAA